VIKVVKGIEKDDGYVEINVKGVMKLFTDCFKIL